MNYSNLLKIALRAIGANKMRSFLTALGIIIGVASVITMLAIGQGSKNSIQANIAEMGSNMIMISPGADMRGGVRQDASSMETLKMTDYEAIKDECDYIKGISPTVTSSGQWIYGNNNTPSSIYGVNQDYMDIRQLAIEDGVLMPTLKQRQKYAYLVKQLLTTFLAVAPTQLEKWLDLELFLLELSAF